MKKLLSVILSLVLIMGTICAVPAFSASADAPGFNLNDWYVTQGAGGTVTSDTTAGTVAFTGTQYGAMYTKVSNLEVGKTYDFSFDTSPTSSFQLWVVPGTETLSFSNGLPNNSTRKHIISVSGTTFSAQITPEVTSYWFVFRNETGTAATSAFTFSNFKFEEASAEVLAGIAIADGNWKATNGTVTNNTNAHTVTATG
ncbi:MAG: hypothetical protein IJC36_00025, partial [Clostridia bacterium]|nr:hypothetical protein [Clostridia bacterium]